LLSNKYLRTKTLTQVSTKPNDSHFWRGLMHIKDEALSLLMMEPTQDFGRIPG
jgi:hypothetical protein